MRCPRCGFENLPGLTVCMRCNSVLVATAKVNVHPPRAGWTLIFRPLRYRFNIIYERIPWDAGRRLDEALSRSFHGLQRVIWGVLSIVPGLGHLLSGRFRHALPLWLAWAVLLLNGVLFQSTYWGSVAIGLAIAAHSWLLIDAARIREIFRTVFGRLAIAMVLWFLFSWLLYGGVQRHVVAGAIPGVPIATHRIAANDYIVCWRPGEWRRGDLVLYKIHGTGPVINFGFLRETFQIRGGAVVGRLLAFPGEKVRIRHGQITVHTAAGKIVTYSYPPLAILFGPGEHDTQDFDLVVKPGRYLCFPANIKIQNDWAPAAVLLDDIGMPERRDIWGRGVMVYNTFFHRRPLPRLPLDIITEGP